MMLTPDQRKILESALEVLAPPYLGRLSVSPKEIEERPSLVWRGDSIILGSDTPRWAYRIWLREESGGRLQDAGFCNLRPLDKVRQWLSHAQEIPPVADAYLRPPCHMLDPTGGYVIYTLSHLHAVYGESSSCDVTCYSQPHQSVGGYCAHAALFMCLTMICQQLDLRVPAVHETAYDVAQRAVGKKGEEDKAIQADGSFRVRGLGLREMAEHVGSEMVGGSGVTEMYEATNLESAIHGINEYLRHGLPVILCVDYAKLYRNEPRRLQRMDVAKEHAHVVVLVGAWYPPDQKKFQVAPTAFIYHDSRAGPYLEKPAEELLRSGAEFKDKDYRNKVSFFVPMPRGVVCPLSKVYACIEPLAAARRDQGLWRRFFGGPRPSLDAAHVRYRLVAASDIGERYFSTVSASDDVRTAFAEGQDLPNWFWIVEGYPDGESMAQNEASELWFYAATKKYISAYPHLRDSAVAHLKHGCLTLRLPGHPTRYLSVAGSIRVVDRGPLHERP